MMLRVAKANKSIVKNPMMKSSISCRCAVAISRKVSKKAVVRNKIRRMIQDHLKLRLYHLSQHNDKWALISLKPQPIQKDISHLLSECDKLLFNAGLSS